MTSRWTGLQFSQIHQECPAIPQVLLKGGEDRCHKRDIKPARFRGESRSRHAVNHALATWQYNKGPDVWTRLFGWVSSTAAIMGQLHSGKLRHLLRSGGPWSSLSLNLTSDTEAKSTFGPCRCEDLQHSNIISSDKKKIHIWRYVRAQNAALAKRRGWSRSVCFTLN